MERIWNIKQPADSSLVTHLQDVLGVDSIIANLLIQRGITTFEDAKSFFRPSLDMLHDPFLMRDMEKAVVRIEEAILKQEGILVYGDYDVDGTTSVALVYSILKDYFNLKHIDYYIPNRYNEGYGISVAGIDFAVENGYSLIISLDCGIKAVEKIEYACSKNIDFIICDHHTPGAVLPAALATLDPRRDDCCYPDKNLSGCGVGFKLMQALCRHKKVSEDPILEYLDLVAVSIASDIVPIMGENRILSHFGLKKLNTNPMIGLASIIKISGMEGREMSISDIVFKIGPRINAAGRIESGRDAVKLLVCGAEDAQEFSEDIDKFNNTRKDLDRQITQEALDYLSSNPEFKNRKTTVLFNPEWNKGVIGIVASRLTETYYRPTVVLTESKGFATGSARSVDGFDLYKAVDACSDLLENFGGHMYAAGLTMKVENVPLFRERFEKYVNENIHPDLLIPQIEVDSEIQFEEINPKFFRILQQFHPFGPGNMRPVFVTRNVFDFGTSKSVGKDKNHLKLEIIDSVSGKIMHGIAFQMGEHIDKIKNGAAFDICYTIEENTFNNQTNLQLVFRDIKFE